MIFELLDRYLLDGVPAKADLVKALLANPSDLATAAPFYEGMKILGARTPDLTFIALRLVLAGRTADDASVVELRSLVQKAHAAGAGESVERRAYHEALTPA